MDSSEYDADAARQAWAASGMLPCSIALITLSGICHTPKNYLGGLAEGVASSNLPASVAAGAFSAYLARESGDDVEFVAACPSHELNSIAHVIDSCHRRSLVVALAYHILQQAIYQIDKKRRCVAAQTDVRTTTIEGN